MAKSRERQDIMLAHPMTSGKLQGYGKCLLQPKLNGERCHVEWFNGEPILASSTGLEFPYLNHIKEALQPHAGLNTDGELYFHGMSRDDIVSRVNRKKNKHPDEGVIQFHIFDYINFQDLQAERVVKLGREQFEEPLVLVPTHIITLDQIADYTNYYLNLGYEGIILRHPLGIYETKRSNAMLKHKPTEIDYYVILGVKEAISEDGELKGMVGAFTVLSPGKDTFEVGAGKLTHSERIDLWLRKDEILYKMLKVKHEKIKTGKNGVPISCVAVSIASVQEALNYEFSRESDN